MRRPVGRFGGGLHWQGLSGYGLGCQGRDGGAQGRIRGEYTVIAVAVLARRRYQCGDALDELQGRENQFPLR